MPNSFAFLMIFAWPVLAFIAFRRMPLPMGISAAVIGAMLVLPQGTGINLPMLPEFNKAQSGTLAALLLILAASRSRAPAAFAGAAASGTQLRGWLPRSRWMQACLVGIFAGGVATVYLNGEALNYGRTNIAGLTTYDIFNVTLSQIMILLPFLIARKYLATPEAQKMFLMTLVVAGVLYTIPTLYEVRMSPQLNRQLYGFFQSSFVQHMRQGGYRPVVFLPHGLQLSLFLELTFLAALACIHIAKPQYRTRFILAAVLLFGTLFLSKSLGALMVAVLLAPVMFFFPTRLKLLAAAAIAATTLSYPVLRGNNLVPVEQIVSFASSINELRVNSLQFRLDQEDILLEKANEKPLFGWGGWGRSRVFDQYGRDVSVTDGTWVILFGGGGWVRYITTFGLLCLPALLLALRRKKLKPEDSAAALALLVAGNMVDLIPNSGLTTITWMMAGALAGRLELQTVAAPNTEAAADDADNAPSRLLFSPGRQQDPFGARSGKGSFGRPATAEATMPNAPRRAETGGNPYAPKFSKPDGEGN